MYEFLKNLVSGNAIKITEVAAEPECKHFYFDFGTNVGIQTRKLFQPELYPGSGILPYFNMYFGEPSERRIPGAVCAIGVEPNTVHDEALYLLETSYNRQKWFTRFYTRSGVGVSPGWMLLHSDGDTVNNELGAHLVSDVIKVNVNTPGAVKILDVVELINSYLNSQMGRSSNTLNRKIVVKVDIEGMDTTVIHYLNTSGVLCKIDFVYVEHMKSDEIQILNDNLLNQGCPTLIIFMDDEEYHNSNFPLP